MTGRVALWMLSAAVAWGAAVSAPSAQQRRAGGADLSEYLPPGPGQALVAKTCASCHDLRGTLQLRKPKDGWEAIVLDMGARGAPIMMDDVDPIVAYLSTAFGPQAPPFTDASVATREDWMKLPGVTEAAAARVIEARAKAPLASHEQIRTALGLDGPAFEKIKYYVYVKPAAASQH